MGDLLDFPDACALKGRRADHAGLGVEFFEVLDDGCGFGEETAVVEFQHRELAQGIAGQVLGLALFALPKIDADFG